MCRNKKNICIGVFLMLALVGIAAQYLFSSPIFEGLLFNADTVYLSIFFTDFFEKGGQFKDWFFTPAPYFFPDFLIFLPAYFIGETAYGQAMAYTFLQIALVFLAIFFLAKAVINENVFFTSASLLIALIWLALNAGEPFILIISSAYHYGIFLVAIVLTTLWIKCLSDDKKQKKIIFCILMMALAFAATLSDGLFLVQSIAALVAMQIFTALVARDFSFKNKLPLVFVSASSLLGVLLYPWIISNDTRFLVKIELSALPKALSQLYPLLHEAIVNKPVYGVIFLLYIGIVLYTLIQTLRDKKRNDNLSWLVIFSFFAFCTTLSPFVLQAELLVQDRYLIPALTWPVIIVFIFASFYLRHRFIPIAIAISLLALASISWNSYQLFERNGVKVEYQPDAMSCIDDLLEKENLYNGIAGYWDAKRLKSFSRLDLNLAQYDSKLESYFWITSSKYFQKNYDFAILYDRVDPTSSEFLENLTRVNGEPKLIKDCGTRVVYIYGKNKMQTKRIEYVGDAYTWQACELFTDIGEKTAGCTIKKKDNALAGFVTFGPYKVLPAGEYNFEITYSSTASTKNIVGDWDVFLPPIRIKKKILDRGFMPGTDGIRQKIRGSFTLDADQNMRKIEVRTLARPNADLEVISLRIERVR